MMHKVRRFDLRSVDGLSSEAIELHLGLYKGYVEEVNRLEARRPDANAYVRQFAFEWNGMILHELFFEQLAGPRARAKEQGAFAHLVKRSFAAPAAWRKDVAELAATRGVGWVATALDPRSARLHNIWIDLHQLALPAGVDLVFVLDMWEHAWLPDFPPKQKAKYVAAVLDNVDWTVLNARCMAATAAPAA